VEAQAAIDAVVQVEGDGVIQDDGLTGAALYAEAAAGILVPPIKAPLMEEADTVGPNRLQEEVQSANGHHTSLQLITPAK
jgi:hypothetical protein